MDTEGWFESADRWQHGESLGWLPQAPTHYRRDDDRSVPGSTAAVAWDERKAELRDMASTPAEDLDTIADGIRRTNNSLGLSMTDDQIKRAALDVQQNGARRAAEDLAEMEWDDLLRSAVLFDSRIGSYIDALHPELTKLIDKWPQETPMPIKLTPLEVHPVVIKVSGVLAQVCWPDNPALAELRAAMEELHRDTGRIGVSRYEPPIR
jgi:hypothetical protein